MAQITILEEDNPWQGENPIEDILAKLETNPFVTIQEMELNYSSQKQPYQHSAALSSLKKGKEASVELSGQQTLRFRGAITRGDWRNTIVMMVANKSLKELIIAELLKFTQELATLLPRFLRAEVQTNPEISDYYNEQNIEWVPECFGNFIQWYHLISPLGYSPYFSREEILNIPASQVRELENGWIEVISYPDPLAYDQPEARTGIITITNYLNAHRKDWQKAAIRVG